MRRDCLGGWLPEALASILVALYALGGKEADGNAILESWGLGDGTAEEASTLSLERWMDRQAKHG